jgi:hypothetical protein
MRRKERFKARAQGGIVAAFTIEKLRSLISGLRQRQLKQEFFAVWVHGAAGPFCFASASSKAASFCFPFWIECITT